MNHLLETDSVQLEFGLRKILTDVYLKIETGHITGLLGRNGAGKTCLMNIIYGSLETYGRSVRLDGKAIFHAYKSPHILLYLPQFSFIPGRIKVSRVFKDFGLDYNLYEKHFPEFRNKWRSRLKDLSGGQRRLLEVYSIVKAGTQFVLLDEPFSHIMPVQVEKMKEILQEEKANKGILITDHLYQHITDISDSLYVLTNGKTCLTRDISELQTLGYTRS